MIYKTFKEWAAGLWLEDGEPRKQAYTRDELLLIEMGWNYGKEAGVAAEREACAKVCEKLGEEYNNEINKKLCIGDELQDVANDCAESIRARGQE